MKTFPISHGSAWDTLNSLDDIFEWLDGLQRTKRGKKKYKLVYKDGLPYVRLIDNYDAIAFRLAFRL